MSDPGLDAARPFRFQCRRSGNCCTVPNGHVWIEEEECAAMARAAGLEEGPFRERFTRTVTDPASGELRLALRDDERGRCALLEGANHCTVYEARPEHCRAFPYWPSVLAGEDGFERVRETCPGIEPVVADPEPAFDALEELYRDVDAFVEKAQPVCIVRGVCCRFEEAGHRLYATALEADYAAHRHPDAPPPEAEGRCPYHVGGRCTAREGRPLGCRTYFCDNNTASVLEEAHEHFLARLREIERTHDYPHSYSDFPAQLAARGIGAEGER